MADNDLFTVIDHVAIAYPDIDAAVKFFVEQLNWHELHREVNEDQGVAESMLLPTAEFNPLMTRVQIVSPVREDATVAKWLAKNGRPGLHHVAYRVEDIDKTSAVLRERGMKLLYDEPRVGTAGSRINFVHPKSANYVLTELVEAPKEA
jgi:methylmalonyl-CoA/ethylmalonyl-CoA epimerase